MKADPFLKSLTVVSTAALATLWVGWHLFQDVRNLDVALDLVERHTLAAALLDADTRSSATIATTVPPDRPSHGSLVETLGTWDVPIAVSGTIRVEGGRRVDFIRSEATPSRQTFRVAWSESGDDPSTITLVRGALNGAASGWGVASSQNVVLDPSGLQSAVRRISGRWNIDAPTPLATYQALNRHRADLTVKIPLLGVDVTAGRASWALMLAGFVLAILQFHHAMGLLRCVGVENAFENSASILAPPSPPAQEWLSGFGAAIWMLAVSAYIAMAAAPIAIFLFGALMQQGVGWVLSYAPMAVTLFIAGATVFTLCTYARSAWRRQ